jgi:hypothetical protein
MFATPINREPNNHAEFSQVKESLHIGSAAEVFKEGLEKLNPTPAQLLQLLEITLLSPSALPAKNEFMQMIGERAASAVMSIHVSRGEEVTALQMIDAYRDAAQITAFCQDELALILSNTKDANGLSAAEINSYLFAKLQDTLRFVLNAKRLPVEDREPYSDPAPGELERSREDFLVGRGIFDPVKAGFLNG